MDFTFEIYLNSDIVADDYNVGIIRVTIPADTYNGALSKLDALIEDNPNIAYTTNQT